MNHKNKHKEILAIKHKMEVKQVVETLQSRLLQLANWEELEKKRTQLPAVDIRSVAIESKQNVQGNGWHKTYYDTSKIRLTGNWLRESGFHPDGRVKVVALKGMLVICPE